MTQTQMLGDRARWSVLWIKHKNGKKRVVEIDFENDLDSAMTLYAKALAAKKPFATLRSCNVAFPPPAKYQPQWVQVKKPTDRFKTVSKGGKRYRKRVYRIEQRWHVPMEAVNSRGIWWCPYCRKFRRFVKQRGFRVSGVYVPESGLHCPICTTSHRDFYVRKWNPDAKRVYSPPPKARRSNGRG